jgi:hypothetical protein
MVIKDRWLLLGAYSFLFIPIVIFCIGFLKWFVGIPISLLLGLVILKVAKKSKDQGEIHIGKGELIGGIVIVLVWVWLSGIGGFAYQNHDFNNRNALLRDLVNFRWPVYYLHLPGAQATAKQPPLYAMIYYMGYFLPAALFGKILGLNAAFIFLYVWTLIGVFYVILLMKKILKSSLFFVLLLLIFFSGMDAVGTLLMSLIQPGGYPALWPPIQHLEWWAHLFQYSSFTTQLFWVFNQAIPVWCCLALYLAFPNPRQMILLWGLCFFFAPLPAIGFLPLIVAQLVKDFLNSKKVVLERSNHPIFQKILSIGKAWLTYNNFVGGILISLSIAYFASNQMSGTIRFIDLNLMTIIFFLLFIFLEGILIWLVLGKVMRRNPLWYAIGITLIICPLLIVGEGTDFVMRVSIPSLFILMVWAGECLRKRNWDLKPILIGYLTIGALTPLYEINRSVYRTAEYYLSPSNQSEMMMITPQEVMNSKYIPETDHPGSLLADGFITLANFPVAKLQNNVGDIQGTFLQKYLFKSPQKYQP